MIFGHTLSKLHIIDVVEKEFFKPMNRFTDIFSEKTLADLFPADRTNEFFDALFGDASEGAYDIQLAFDRFDEGDETLHFRLELHERPGCCLACNLTYGLPDVFARHPIINISGLVKDIDAVLGEGVVCEEWKLGTTKQEQSSIHSIPLVIAVRKKQ